MISLSNRIEELIESLYGTCQSLCECCEKHEIEEEDFSIEEIKQLDSEIFQCTSCGWWSEAGEQNEEGECQECIND